jgi:hypothetical protein
MQDRVLREQKLLVSREKPMHGPQKDRKDTSPEGCVKNTFPVPRAIQATISLKINRFSFRCGV